MTGFIAIILILVLWSKVSNLRKEVTEIKAKLVSQISEVPHPPHTQENRTPLSAHPEHEEYSHSQSEPKEYFPPAESPQESVQATSHETHLQAKKDPFVIFTNWLKENWMLKIGVLLILVGFGWFMSYMFIHNWIGPVGRVTLGFVVGTLLTLFGSVRMEKNMTQGKVFLILGSALVIITSYSARVVYDFFNPTIALGIVFLVSAYVAATALQLQKKEIALYGLGIAFLAPILTDGSIETTLLFTYLAVVSLASIWLASVRGWGIINSAAIIGFGIFTLPRLVASPFLSSGDRTFILFTIFALGLVYFAVSVIGAIKNKTTDSNSIVVAVVDSALIIFTTYQLVTPELQSLTLAAWMIVFAIGSYLTFTKTGKEKFFYLYSLVAILLLAIATSMELDGNSLLYAYAFESALISVAGYIITKRLDIGYTLSFLMAIPIFMSLPSLSSRDWNNGMFNESFMILLVVGALTCLLGWFYRKASQDLELQGVEGGEKFYMALSVIGSLFFLALIWKSAGAEILGSGSVLLSLVIYTIIGIITYFTGLFRDINPMKYYGATLILLVVLRLILVDVWNMDLPIRVATFILIGVLFISTSFITKKTTEKEPLIIEEN